MYEAIIAFADGENGIPWSVAEGGYGYSEGDTYPKEGINISEEHLKYLLSDKNKFGKPVIKKLSKKTESNKTKDKE